MGAPRQNPGQGKRLTNLRRRARMSRPEFAAAVGVHVNSVYYWETERVWITPAKAADVARVCDVGLSDVLGYELPAAEVPVGERLTAIEEGLAEIRRLVLGDEQPDAVAA